MIVTHLHAKKGRCHEQLGSLLVLLYRDGDRHAGGHTSNVAPLQIELSSADTLHLVGNHSCRLAMCHRPDRHRNRAQLEEEAMKNVLKQYERFTHNEIDYDVELWPKYGVRFRIRPTRKFLDKITVSEMQRAVRAFRRANDSRIDASRPGNA